MTHQERIDAIYEFTDLIMKSGKLLYLDWIFENWVQEKVYSTQDNLDYSLALLTATLPVKSQLVQRAEFLDKCKFIFGEELFIGL